MPKRKTDVVMGRHCQKAWNIREEWATDMERWKDTVRRDLKAWNTREEWATDKERWKGLCRTRHTPQSEMGAKAEKYLIFVMGPTQVVFTLKMSL